jgi:Tol biopolymer transport system component
MNPDTLLYPGEEKHLKDLRQLTFEGENAEAYWHPDGKHLVLQARWGDIGCDRIYTLDLDSLEMEQISNGKGRTTCAYYTWPSGDDVIFASTHLGGAECPPEPDFSQGYVWPIFPSYELFVATSDGASVQLTDNDSYDAEATVCFEDGRTVFTSTRDGDLDLYIMDEPAAGSTITRITDEPGYDGGAFFSPDCSKLVWRASRPEGQDLENYWALLKDNKVRPSTMELFVAKSDGSEARQLTHNGKANFAPYFLPDNRHVIFSSNMEGGGRNFDLFLLDTEAPEPAASIERVTFSPVFESFPMFSPDGRQIVFASNRNAKVQGETNLFLATWID